MVALGTKKDWLITHDEKEGWALCGGLLLDAAVALFLMKVTW
jgi:hypothetical protein